MKRKEKHTKICSRMKKSLKIMRKQFFCVHACWESLMYSTADNKRWRGKKSIFPLFASYIRWFCSLVNRHRNLYQCLKFFFSVSLRFMLLSTHDERQQQWRRNFIQFISLRFPCWTLRQNLSRMFDCLHEAELKIFVVGMFEILSRFFDFDKFWEWNFVTFQVFLEFLKLSRIDFENFDCFETSLILFWQSKIPKKKVQNPQISLPFLTNFLKANKRIKSRSKQKLRY